MNKSLKKSILSFMNWLDHKKVPAEYDFVEGSEFPVKIIIENVTIEFGKRKKSIANAKAKIRNMVNCNFDFEKEASFSI
jgi:hypothetical protein